MKQTAAEWMPNLLERLRDTLAQTSFSDPQHSAASCLTQLLALGLDRLPLPGSGATLQRWQALALVASHDLSLAKLYEGHTDALAILLELGAPVADGVHGSWGVWAAESPQGKVMIEPAHRPDAEGHVLLYGTKFWCSGAQTASHALLTAWLPDATGPQLVRVVLDEPGVEVSAGAWQAVGMAGSASLDVTFSGASAQLVRRPSDYLERPGFWQGGAGIAACWYGGALGLANALRRSLQDSPAASRHSFRLAALGKVDVLLRGTAALLREAAHWIDTHPLDDARATALRTRLSAEHCAAQVLDETGRALGATPFCRDARFARAAADLPVFIRQSHAERDLAALGEQLLDRTGTEPWVL